jgi:hypothetical protein
MMRREPERTMDSNLLMISLLFGAIGMGMFMYGKRAGRMIPLGAGAALMAVPYFIPNVVILLTVCCALTALPWFIREA